MKSFPLNSGINSMLLAELQNRLKNLVQPKKINNFEIFFVPKFVFFPKLIRK